MANIDILNKFNELRNCPEDETIEFKEAKDNPLHKDYGIFKNTKFITTNALKNYLYKFNFKEENNHAYVYLSSAGYQANIAKTINQEVLDSYVKDFEFKFVLIENLF